MRKQPSYRCLGVLCTLLLFFVSCERNADPDPQQLGWEYYPVQLGQYNLYDVYQINYNFAEENDTLTYELKEVVEDYFLNQQEDTVYLLRRYHRSTPDNSWVMDSTYQLIKTVQWVVQTANNRPVIKLSFPIEEGRIWNANLLNTAEPDQYTLSQVGASYETAYASYTNTLQVIQEELVDKIVETNQRKEVYASEVGLVYKRINNIKYCTAEDCLGQEIINSGLYQEVQLKESGVESL